MTDASTSPGAGDPLGRSQVYKDLVLLPLAALVFLADQFSKSLVREFLALRESIPAEGFFRISHTYNTGSAFGLFQGQNSPLILASLIGVTVLVLIYYSQRRPTLLLRLSLGLQLGGAAGNLLDRVLLGRVTDFLDVGAWPIFNVADASIVTGLVLLGWIFVTGGREAKREEAGMSWRPAAGRTRQCWKVPTLYARCATATCGLREWAGGVPPAGPGSALKKAGRAHRVRPARSDVQV